jgi:2,3-bisphosphoglycerate-dependent phosphoglycerate mutase
MDVMAELLLVRHCASTGQAPEASLTPDGASDAAALAERLIQLGCDAVVSSPYRRAIDTIAPFATCRGLDIAIDERLAERRLEGVPSPHWLDHVRRSFDNESYRAPGGETLAEARARGLAALAGIASWRHIRPAVVTHGNLLSSLLRSVDPHWGFEQWRALGNPELFSIEIAAERLVAFERVVWR